MLQRAASNAYSWWWASHIRTKQSKWMEQNLLDMEEKVQIVLKLITEDGDSFAKRAEMYYKKRPELISYVEESYRAYRALAERYDKISTELQNANNTIASVFPEQVQFSMEDDDDDDNGLPIMPKKLPNASKMSIPRVPKGPMKDFKSEVATAKGANKLLPKKTGSAKVAAPKAVPKSGLSKTEALEEIDKLQKHILSLQTEKEFVKSSYENGLTKYWEIEEKIKEIQEKIICLQEECGKGMTIEDAEARSLMAAAAIKSCQEKLTQLQEKQERSAKEAGLEHERIKEAREKLASLRDEFDCNQINEESSYRKHESAKTGKYFSLQQEAAGNSTIKEKHELDLLREKIKEQFDTGSDTPLTVTEMVEKIDGLVNKVICLETAVSSQNALVKILKTETEELQVQIQTLVNDKASLIDDKNTLRNKLKEMEEKFHEIQDLSESFKNQNDSLQTYFTEAHVNLDNLSEKLQNVKPDEEELEDIVSTGKENRMNLDHSEKLQDIILLHKDVEFHSTSMLERQERDARPVANKELVDIVMELKEWAQGTEDEPDWQKLYLNGMGDKEKTLIDEYTATLRNYKDVKKKLSEVEKENQDSHCEKSILIKELENTIAKKDEEIKSLRMKLGLLQQALEECEESNDVKDLDSEQTSTSLRAESTKKSTDEGREDVKVNLIEPTCTMSTVEEKFRMDIDELLEENLNFWMKFSSSFQSLQRFETEIQDLQKEISMVEKNKKTQEGSTTLKHLLKSDVRPLYQHLREIQTELSVWLKMSMSLKDELQCRFTSLCNFQDEITKALKESAEDDDFKFTSYQAAKFQGEVLNMKQENNKVESELEAGIDHATTLQNNVEKTLNNLNEEYGISGSKKNNDPKFLHSNTANRHSVPLRSFIFGVKPKKQKSIFSCMTPTTHRKFHARSGHL